MSETWIVTDENWSLPISVDWPEQSDVAAVRYLPGFPMLNIQRDALAAKLNAAGKYRAEVWWVLRSMLEAIATQTVEDPERLMVWRHVEARVKYREEPHSTAREEFFAEMARSSIVNDPLKCELLWTSFCRVVLSWMLNHQRPAPMGFCELYAVPYRPNWKQMVFGTLLRSRQGGRGLPNFSPATLAKSSMESLLATPAPDEMINPKLLFWCKKDNHMYWSIEARPRNMWWRMVKAVELAKKKKRPGARYLSGVADTMKRLLPQSLELYASWLQQMAQPYVRLGEVSRYNRRRFMRVGKVSENMLRKAPGPESLPVALGDESKGRKSVPLDDVSTAAFMSSLSDIQQRTLSMRDARDEMERSLNRKT